MDNEAVLKNGLDAIYLMDCLINDILPDKERVSQMDLKSLLSFARNHKISATLGKVLCQIVNDAEFNDEYNRAVYRAIMFENERNDILAFFEEKGIWYCLLKGCVLIDYYPEFGIRQMADNDILVDASRAKDIYDFMTARGYEIPHGMGLGAHDAYYKEPFYNFEMHMSLFAQNDSLSDYYYRDIKDRLLQVGDSHQYVFTKEDFYVYYIAHGAKHFSNSGTGLRIFPDVYFYLKKEKDLDFSYIEQELAKLELKDFEQTIRNITFKLFDTHEELTADENAVLNYIIGSGAYGNVANRIRNTIDKMSGEINSVSKFRYILRRIFPDWTFVKLYFPLVYKYKFLYPGLIIFRIVRLPFVKEKAARTRNEMNYLRKIK